MINSKVIRQAQILTGPYQVSVDVTNKCNYRCIHCYNNSGENQIIDNEMSDNELIKLFEDLAEIKPVNVCLCGGEPLLRLDVICKCANIITSNGVSIVSMVSNGYFLTQEVAEKLMENGIKNVQISLDGAQEDTCTQLRGNKEAFNRAIEALKILVKNGFRTNIAFSPTAFNINEFEDVCKICEDIGVNEIRVQPMMIIGRAQKHIEKLIPSNYQYIELKRKINEVNRSERNLSIDWGDPVDHIIRYRGDMKDIYTFISIKANGDIPISPYIPLTVGNIIRHKFIDYWNQGLASIWNLDVCSKYSNKINCISDMANVGEDGKLVWFDIDEKIDIIDDNIVMWKENFVAQG